MSNLIIIIFGASIGSFLNVLIDRLPNNESIMGRSHCDYCKKKIAWYDLIPVLSYFILKGKSRCCHKKLSFQYPLVEIITAIIFFFLLKTVFLEDSLLERVSLLGIVVCLIVIFFSDLKYHLISDYVLLAFGVFSLFYRIFYIIERKAVTFQVLKLVGNDIFFSLISAFIVGFPIFLIYYLSRERAMGLGDVYLSAIIGFLLGWKDGFIALYIAFVTGAIVGLILIIFHKKKLKSMIAFGPFLVLGTVIMLFWSEKIYYLINKFYGF